MFNSKERLHQFIRAKELSVAAFERMCGFSNGYVKMLRSGVGRKLDKISAAFPELNMVWLLTGEGEMIKQSSPNQHKVYNNIQIGNENSSTSVNVGNNSSYSPAQHPSGRKHADREYELARLKASIEEQKNVIAQKISTILDREQTIAEKDKIIAAKDAEIVNLLRIINEKDTQLIAEKERLINVLLKPD